MKEKIQKGLAAILMFVLVISCFAAVLQITIANPTPVPGNPGWDNKYQAAKTVPPSLGPASDIPNNPRNNASGDKISSNAHSADFPGLYFYWDDKQKDNGTLLVNPEVFNLFKGGEFTLTAKNSNNYWGYTISPATGTLIDGVYAFGILKQIKYNEIGNNGKVSAKTEDLKNINMVFIDGEYKDAYVVISKLWKDEDGKPFANAVNPELNALLKFNNGAYKLGTNTISITTWAEATKGKSVTITEAAIAGFKADQQSITVKVKADETAYAKFVNQKQYANIVIEKIWLDNNGVQITDVTILAKLEAKFTINGEPAVLGDNKVKEGTYIVSEASCTKGYSLIGDKDREITVEAGKSKTVTFINYDPTTYKVTLMKTVDGTTFEAKFPEGYTMTNFIDDVTFTLNEAYDLNSPVPESLRLGNVEGEVVDGFIIFDVKAIESMQRTRGSVEGWYFIKETYKLGSIAEEIFEEADSLYVYFDGRNIFSNVDTFDYDAYYTIVNGWGSGYVLGYGKDSKLINNNGDIFPIGVINTNTNKPYVSFCANVGSVSFYEGYGNYMVALKDALPAGKYGDFVKAYNYIEDTYGDLDDYRAVTQIVTWYLLGAIDVESTAFDNIDWALVETGYGVVKGIPDPKATVLDVIDNYATHIGEGKIVDVVFMVGKDNADFHTAQPQLVPVYKGTHVFNNKLKETFDVEFTKTKYGGKLPVAEGEFEFELFKFNAETNKYDLFGSYSTDAKGVVATKLAPGNYVFKEALTTYAIPTINEYKLVWKAIYPKGADGLYFELKADGTVIWAGDESITGGTVDNIFFDKNYIQWIVGSSDSYTGMGEVGDVFDDGFIFYPSGKDATESYPSFTYTEPTCMQGGVMWFFYGDNQPLMSIGFADPLGHDYALNAIGDGLCCTRGDFDRGYWELDAKLLAIYHSLGGLGGL